MPGHGRGNATTAPTTTKPRSHTLKRLVKYILTDKLRVAVVIIACALATTTMVLGPKIMGQATNVLFEGVISKMLPAGSSASAREDAVGASCISNPTP